MQIKTEKKKQQKAHIIVIIICRPTQQTAKQAHRR